MDAMKSETLPTLQEVKAYYQVPFDAYAVSMFHPVTTEFSEMNAYAEAYVAALEESGCNYVVIYPNNDSGSDYILGRLLKLQNNKRFRIFPSVRFEAFLTLLKNALFIVGNSSAGIREAPCYGVPTVNVGTRQNGRTANNHIVHTSYAKQDIVDSIHKALQLKVPAVSLFGDGKSDQLFYDIVKENSFWQTQKQKAFTDVL